MSDYSGAAPRAHDTFAARDAAADVNLEASLALARAAARTLRELSPDAETLFKRHLQREIDRLKLSGPGTPDLVLMRLREFTQA